MTIDFPASPVNGNTYSYLGTVYTFIKNEPHVGYWANLDPSLLTEATTPDINEDVAGKYITPDKLGQSKYVREDEITEETQLNFGGAKRFKATSQGVEVTGKIVQNGSELIIPPSATEVEIDAGVNGSKFISPVELENSKYVREEEIGGATHVNYNGAAKLSSKTDGVDVTGKLYLNGLQLVQYRVGDVFLTMNAGNPGSYLGGTWELLEESCGFRTGGGQSLSNAGLGNDLVSVPLPSHDHTTDTTFIGEEVTGYITNISQSRNVGIGAGGVFSKVNSGQGRGTGDGSAVNITFTHTPVGQVDVDVDHAGVVNPQITTAGRYIKINAWLRLT